MCCVYTIERWEKKGLWLWAHKTQFILVLLFTNHCIIFSTNTCKCTFVHPCLCIWDSSGHWHDHQHNTQVLPELSDHGAGARADSDRENVSHANGADMHLQKPRLEFQLYSLLAQEYWTVKTFSQNLTCCIFICKVRIILTTMGIVLHIK